MRTPIRQRTVWYLLLCLCSSAWALSSNQVVGLSQSELAVNAVHSIAISPDGKTIAAGRRNGWITLFDASTGKELQTYWGHRAIVTSVEFRPNDNNTLASGSWDKTAKLWDVSTNQVKRGIENVFPLLCWSVTFSPDGKTWAITDNDLYLWDVSTGKRLREIPAHTETNKDWGAVLSVKYNPNGEILAGGDNRNRIQVWNASTGQYLGVLLGHSGWVNSVAFSPDGKTLVSGSKDKTVKLWDLKTATELHTFNGHSDEVNSVTFSLDGRIIASGANDGAIKFWDPATGKELRTIPAQSRAILSVIFSPDKKTLVSGNGDGTVKIWDVATGKLLHRLAAQANLIK